MSSTRSVALAGCVFLSFAWLAGPSRAAAAPVIDTAQSSGVAGYPIGIFGTGFGAAAGRVSVLGVQASVSRWSDTVIEAVVPRIADGAGSLVVEAAAGSVSRPFVVYSVAPAFLATPTRLDNVIYGKPVVITGPYTQWGGSATSFLTYNNGGGAADLGTPTALAVDLGAALTGPLWWSFFGSGDWYEYPTDNPRSYVIEGSADSTNGQNGAWSALLAVTGNDRASRTHLVSLSGQRWIRMRVTATTGGATYRLRELRAFRARAGDTARLDSLGVYGDSITTGDLGVTGATAFYQVLRGLKGDGSQAITYVMGMVGQNTHVLLPSAASSDPSRALSVAIAMQPDIRYWGIALGTNDTNDQYFSAATLRANLLAGIQQLLAAGKVPILARIPDTAAGGFGSAPTKKAALAVIDELAATYRLIPGPDFYTPFRQNLATYLSDGTHHTAEGSRVENRLWAEALVRAGLYGGATAPSPSLSIGDVSVTEGNGGTTNAVFTVSLSAASATAVTVGYATAGGTATSGGDFTATSGTLTLAAGALTGTITVPVVADLLDEPNETFTVTLSNASGATIADAQGVGTIVDDDPVPTLSIDNVSVTEGNGGTKAATFTVSLSAASGQAVSVTAATANGTASAGSDYTAGTWPLTFAAGVTTRSVAVTVLGDGVYEADETFVVNLTGATGATVADGQGIGTIVNDDLAGFSIGDVDVVEPVSGTRSAVFTVTLAPTVATSTSVSYATTGLTATSGADFTAASGTLTFAAGVASQTFGVPILADAVKEGTETLRVTLSNATGAAIAQGQATGRIHDPGNFFTVTPCRVLDTRNAAGAYGGPALTTGQSRTFTIAGRCGVPATAKAVAVNLTVTGSSAAGNLRLFAADAALPTASALNYRAGETRANCMMAGLSAAGALSLRATQASGGTQVVLDVAGYFE